MLEQLLNQFNLYIWVKDKSNRYIYVNENYAKASGMSSSNQMIGKTDNEIKSYDFTNGISRDDHEMVNSVARLDSVEQINAVAGITDILISETRFIDRNGNILTVKGSFGDLARQQLPKQPGYYDESNQRYYLDIKELGNIYLTLREMEVFKLVLKGWTAIRIANKMNLSVKTIETYILYIRRKFGVETKSELLTVAMQYGLVHLLE